MKAISLADQRIAEIVLHMNLRISWELSRRLAQQRKLNLKSGTASENAGASTARQEQARTLKRTRAMWSSDRADGEATDAVDTSADKPTLRAADYGKLVRALCKQCRREESMPFSGPTEPMAEQIVFNM